MPTLLNAAYPFAGEERDGRKTLPLKISKQKRFMKKWVVLWATLVGSTTTFGQITITDADMPEVNDVFNISVASDFTNVDPSQTGANYTWDFSFLTYATQRQDEYVPPSDAPIAYEWFFNNPLAPAYMASYATIGDDIDIFGFLTMTNNFQFFQNDADEYEMVGFGANINGIPAPVRYNPKDVIYQFPMNYGNIDSSYAEYTLGVPGIGDYSQYIWRNNEVDGWGELTLPLGTFPTLRVKTELNLIDSLDLDTLGFPLGLTRPTTIEYKWLGVETGVPLLTITESFGVITNVEYQDFFVGVEEVLGDEAFAAYPNPANTYLSIAFQEAPNGTIQLLDLEGRAIVTLPLRPNAKNYRINTSTLANGTYVLRFTSKEGVGMRKVVVAH